MSTKIFAVLLAIASTFAASVARGQTANCPADLNYDRWVDSADLSQLLLDFGDCFECPADLDADGAVNGGDVSLMLLDYGTCPTVPRATPARPGARSSLPADPKMSRTTVLSWACGGGTKSPPVGSASPLRHPRESAPLTARTTVRSALRLER